VENYYNPDWWDNWVRKSLKKKATLLHKRANNLTGNWKRIISGFKESPES
jgi:hypothetical protein